MQRLKEYFYSKVAALIKKILDFQKYKGNSKSYPRNKTGSMLLRGNKSGSKFLKGNIATNRFTLSKCVKSIHCIP